MTSAMHVTLVASDHGACTWFRMLWPAEALAGTPGLEMTVIRDFPADQDDGKIGRGACEPDVIAIQRPLSRKIADAVPYLQEQDIAVTVDLDDDFLALHPEHRAQQQLDEETNPSHLVRACLAADLVTAPTQSLLDRYAPHGRGALIRNYLPRWTLDVPDRRNGYTIGWSGVAADHPGDLEGTGGAVAVVLDACRARFHVVGPPDRVAERLGLDQPAWGTGMLPIGDYFNALGSIDVGIVPLGPTKFNAAKSHLKGLEWASAGVPFVASPTPEYTWLAEQGIGTIAHTPQEWKEKLSELLANEILRGQLASTARRRVAERFLLDENAWRWVQAWKRARENRLSQVRRMSPSGSYRPEPMADSAEVQRASVFGRDRPRVIRKAGWSAYHLRTIKAIASGT